MGSPVFAVVMYLEEFMNPLAALQRATQSTRLQSMEVLELRLFRTTTKRLEHRVGVDRSPMLVDVESVAVVRIQRTDVSDRHA
jgi:hypothetical protein